MISSLRCKVTLNEGTDLGLVGWQHFVQGPFWGAIINELKERELFILAILREGKDRQWSDDDMRGRLSELEYVSQIPLTIMLAIKEIEKAAENSADNIQDEKE